LYHIPAESEAAEDRKGTSSCFFRFAFFIAPGMFPIVYISGFCDELDWAVNHELCHWAHTRQSIAELFLEFGVEFPRDEILTLQAKTDTCGTRVLYTHVFHM
jgi:hypothetical protein